MPDKKSKSARLKPDSADAYAAILSGITAGVLVHQDYRPLYANPAGAELLGFACAAELLNQASLRAVFEAKPAGKSNIIIIPTETDRRWLEYNESSTQWQDQVARLVTLVDVSAQMQTERNTALLREAIDELSDSVILYDADDHVVLTNRRFHEALPFLAGPDQIVGMPMEDLIRTSVKHGVITDPSLEDHDDPETWIAQFIERRRTHALYLAEDAWPDGRWDLVREQRLASGGFISVRTDISSRKRAEDALKEHETKLESALLERTKQLEAVLANVAQGVIVLSPDLRVVLTNQGLHDIVGYPPELGQPGTPVEVLIRNRLEHGLHLPGEPDQEVDFDAIVAQCLQAYRDLSHESYRHEFPNGRLIEIRRQKLPDGMIICTFTDVTDQAKAEEEVQRQRETLYQREKLSALGMLLAGVAHELNNPLSVVLGQAQMLEIESSDPTQLRRAGQIRNAAERCAKIVKVFLAMARDEPSTKVPVQLNKLIEQTLDLVAYQLRNREIEVRCELSPDLSHVIGDPDQLNQVFLNLVLNASQAIVDDNPIRCITVRTTTQHDFVELEIRDTGPGIPVELQRRIFDPFFTTKPTGIGTGVGLSVCHGIVTAHGGVISVANCSGGGACFKVRLPAETQVAPISTVPTAHNTQQNQGHVLVIDDQADIGELLIEFLDNTGWEVRAVTSGQDALKQFASCNYDAVICDLRMPEMDGPALYTEVKRLYPSIAQRFIFATGDLLSESYHQFLEQSGQPYLEKPFMPDQVRRLVAKLMDQSSE